MFITYQGEEFFDWVSVLGVIFLNLLLDLSCSLLFRLCSCQSLRKLFFDARPILFCNGFQFSGTHLGKRKAWFRWAGFCSLRGMSIQNTRSQSSATFITLWNLHSFCSMVSTFLLITTCVVTLIFTALLHQGVTCLALSFSHFDSESIDLYLLHTKIWLFSLDLNTVCHSRVCLHCSFLQLSILSLHSWWYCLNLLCLSLNWTVLFERLWFCLRFDLFRDNDRFHRCEWRWKENALAMSEFTPTLASLLILLLLLLFLLKFGSHLVSNVLHSTHVVLTRFHILSLSVGFATHHTHSPTQVLQLTQHIVFSDFCLWGLLVSFLLCCASWNLICIFVTVTIILHCTI